MTIWTGANYSLELGAESSFKSGSGTSFGAVGFGTKLSSYSIKQNMEGVYNLGSNVYAGYYSKGYSIDIGLDFALCGDNKNWIKWLGIGTALVSAYANVGTGEGTKYTVSGIIFKEARITARTGELVMVSLSGEGSNFSSTTGTVATTYPTQFYTFKDVVLSGYGVVTNLELTIDTQAEMLYNLGDLHYVGWAIRGYRVTGSIEAYHDVGSAIPTLLGATPSSLSFSIGSYTFTISDFVMNEGAVTIEPVTPVVDRISFVASKISIV